MDATLAIGLALVAAAFVGVNIGGSSTAAAFGPAVGSEMLTKALAGALMTVFVFIGGWTVGRRVVGTLNEGIVPAETFTLEAGVVVLVFVGCSLLLGNWLGIPASTSETTVGAIVGLGLATQTLQTGLVAEIAAWWVVAPLLALVAAGLVGRFWFDRLQARLTGGARFDDPVLEVDRDGWRPRVSLAVDPTSRRGLVVGLTLLVGCYMAFSAGASNVANAIAPLVGKGAVTLGTAILFGSVAIGLGAFTLARRTLEVLGDDLAQLPLTAALVVELIAASFITVLSAMGIPASLAITTTCTIIGLNLGRRRHQRRTTTRAVPADGGREPPADDLLDTGTTWRSVAVWVLTPTLSAATTYAVFTVVTP